MRVGLTTPFRPNFKAHFYKIEPVGGNFQIQTDNEKNLGKKPEIDYINHNNNRRQCIMSYNGRLHYKKIDDAESIGKIHYKINYKDTNTVDNKNGRDYVVDYNKLKTKAEKYNQNFINHNKIINISNGTATGRLMLADSQENVEKICKENTTPVILWIRDFYDINPEAFPSNVVGLVTISTNSNLETLSHFAASIAHAANASAFVSQRQKTYEIEKLEGKFVELKVGKKSLDIKEIDEEEVKFPPKINYNFQIPKLKPVDKLLTSDKYTADTVGAKALNLARLEKMEKEGKIDVVIPKNFAIPHAYIEKMQEENPNFESTKSKYIEPSGSEKMAFMDITRMQELYSSYFRGIGNTKTANEIISTCNDLGIKGSSVMVRSAFNAEDIDGYSAAGLYSSDVASLDAEMIYAKVMKVARSKWNPRAANSRHKYNIKHSDVKPTVIIQEMIQPDYKFTIYTNDKDDLFKIELVTKDGQERQLFNKPLIPYTFTFNRKTGKIKLEEKEDYARTVTFDENMKVVDYEKTNDSIIKNYEKFKPVLKHIIKNALAVEKEFGKPQDIEGGITFGDEQNFEDEKIYFWQTRNIVQKPNPEKEYLKQTENEMLESLKNDPSEQNFRKHILNYQNTLYSSLNETLKYNMLGYDELSNQVFRPLNWKIDTPDFDNFHEMEKIIAMTHQKMELSERLLKKANAGNDESKIGFMTVFDTALKDLKIKDRKIKIQNPNLAKEFKTRASYFYNYEAIQNVLQNAIQTSPKNSQIELSFSKETIRYWEYESENTFLTIKSKVDKDFQKDILKHTDKNIKHAKNRLCEQVTANENNGMLEVKMQLRV